MLLEKHNDGAELIALLAQVFALFRAYLCLPDAHASDEFLGRILRQRALRFAALMAVYWNHGTRWLGGYGTTANIYNRAQNPQRHRKRRQRLDQDAEWKECGY